MHSFVSRGLVAAALSFVSVTPVSATVLVVSFSGTAAENMVQDYATLGTTSGGAQTITGTIRIDTDRLGANGGAGPDDFSYFRDDAQFLDVDVSFSGGFAPSLGGNLYVADTLDGSFGGFASANKSWVSQDGFDPEGAYLNTTSYFSLDTGALGEIIVDGIRLPDFTSAVDLSFFAQTSDSRVDGEGNTTGTLTTSFGTIDSVSVAIEPTAVPEPATWAMMILGFGLVGAAARRRASFASAA